MSGGGRAGGRAPPGAGPLLVGIDLQRAFAEPSSPWYTPGFEQLRRPIGQLAEAFGERVAFTRFLVPERPAGSWSAYYGLWPFAREAGAVPLLDLVEPFASMPHPVVAKPTFSKWGPELEALAGPARTLVLCGVATDCCVIATALAAADAGLWVRVVGDACRGVDQAAHQRALAIMAGFPPQVEVTTVAQELASRHPAR